MGMSRSATLFGREPHMARERVNSIGADGRVRIVFKRGYEVGVRTRGRGWWARTVGADNRRGLPGACSKHGIGRTTTTFCDHLQQICTIYCI
jgi:hypothetical protein